MSTTRYLKIEFANDDQANCFDAAAQSRFAPTDVLLSIENQISRAVHQIDPQIDCPTGVTGVQANPFDITSRPS